MKSPAITRSWGIVAAVFLLFVGNRASTAQASQADTITQVVGAPRYPRGGWLTEILSIGSVDGADPYQFSRIRAVLSASNGTVWIIDDPMESGSIRQFDSAGRFLRQIGRQGGGPGEYRLPLGMAELKDGRVIVLDWVGRALIYKLDGTPDTTLVFRSRYQWAEQQPVVDTAGLIWLGIALAPPATRPVSAVAYLRIRPNGTIVDTVVPPRVPPPQISDVPNMPFQPRVIRVLSPLGFFATSGSSAYAINFHRTAGSAPWRAGDRIERIQSNKPLVEMSAEEREDRRKSHERALGRSGFKTAVPDFPRTKPAFSSLRFDVDGRLWVFVNTPSERISPSRSGESASALRWQQTQTADVFDRERRYLGRVVFPDVNFAGSRGDTVWGIAYSPEFVPSFKKYKLTWQQ